MTPPAPRRGVWAAISAYALWGLLPLYWKALHDVPARHILAHRIVWSCVVLAGLVAVRREWRVLAAAARHVRTLAIYLVAAILLALNWFTYIWAVNSDRIVESSLGYYINPLVSVVLGVMVLRERLRRIQWLAVLGAGCGVLYLTLHYGQFPWLALALAMSFGLYGLMKKTAPLPALPGLAIETFMLLLPALAYLVWLQRAGPGAFGGGGGSRTALLVLSGGVTVLPLLLFAQAARQVRLSTMGVLQYISPSLGLAIGVLVYGEPFPRPRLIGFAIIWASLLTYWVEGAWRSRVTMSRRD